MYKLIISPDDLKKLWLMREYLAAGSIAKQVRQSVRDFIQKKEEEIGTSVIDATEGIHRHEIEKSQSCLSEQD